MAKLKRAVWFLFCLGLIFLFWDDLPGQDATPRPARPATQSSAEIISSAGSYVREWRRHYKGLNSLQLNGAADENGRLWLITYVRPGDPKDSLTEINADGQLSASYRPVVPLTPIEWVADLSPATSGGNAGALASLASGGKDQVFEGAFFLPVGPDGLGRAVRISGPGPQFPIMIGAGNGEFIAAGDQDPLTLIRLDSTGKILWRRAFSARLVLPTVSVGESGSIFVLSQGDGFLLLQMLDSLGHEIKSKRIAAKQGTVVADPGGGCSLLFTTGYQGNENKVYLMTLNRDLSESRRSETPLVGAGGRTYQLISSPHGHLIAGEGPELSFPKGDRRKTIAEFDGSGKLIWQQSASSLRTPLLAPFRSGFYLVRKIFDSDGIDIEKYSY